MKKSIFFTGLLFLLITACNKDDNMVIDNGSENTVRIKSSTFSPVSIQVGLNSTVTWINDDNTVHTVTADNGSFDSGDIAPGASFRYTFTNSGTYNYHCMHHPEMTGVVIAAGVK
jgi:plastocyanin